MILHKCDMSFLRTEGVYRDAPNDVDADIEEGHEESQP